MFLARLSVCLILLTTCSARPSWHKGVMVVKKSDRPEYNEAQIAAAQAIRDAGEDVQLHMAMLKQRYMDVVRQNFYSAFAPLPFVKKRLDGVEPNMYSQDALPVKNIPPQPLYIHHTAGSPCSGNILNCLHANSPSRLGKIIPPSSFGLQPCFGPNCNQVHFNSHFKPMTIPKPSHSKHKNPSKHPHKHHRICDRKRPGQNCHHRSTFWPTYATVRLNTNHYPSTSPYPPKEKDYLSSLIPLLTSSKTQETKEIQQDLISSGVITKANSVSANSSNENTDIVGTETLRNNTTKLENEILGIPGDSKSISVTQNVVTTKADQSSSWKDNKPFKPSTISIPFITSVNPVLLSATTELSPEFKENNDNIPTLMTSLSHTTPTYSIHPNVIVTSIHTISNQKSTQDVTEDMPAFPMKDIFDSTTPKNYQREFEELVTLTNVGNKEGHAMTTVNSWNEEDKEDSNSSVGYKKPNPVDQSPELKNEIEFTTIESKTEEFSSSKLYDQEIKVVHFNNNQQTTVPPEDISEDGKSNNSSSMYVWKGKEEAVNTKTDVEHTTQMFDDDLVGTSSKRYFNGPSTESIFGNIKGQREFTTQAIFKTDDDITHNIQIGKVDGDFVETTLDPNFSSSVVLKDKIFSTTESSFNENIVTGNNKEAREDTTTDSHHTAPFPMDNFHPTMNGIVKLRDFTETILDLDFSSSVELGDRVFSTTESYFNENTITGNNQEAREDTTTDSQHSAPSSMDVFQPTMNEVVKLGDFTETTLDSYFSSSVEVGDRTFSTTESSFNENIVTENKQEAREETFTDSHQTVLSSIDVFQQIKNEINKIIDSTTTVYQTEDMGGNMVETEIPKERVSEFPSELRDNIISTTISPSVDLNLQQTFSSQDIKARGETDSFLINVFQETTNGMSKIRDLTTTVYENKEIDDLVTTEYQMEQVSDFTTKLREVMFSTTTRSFDDLNLHQNNSSRDNQEAREENFTDSYFTVDLHGSQSTEIKLEDMKDYSTQLTNIDNSGGILRLTEKSADTRGIRNQESSSEKFPYTTTKEVITEAEPKSSYFLNSVEGKESDINWEEESDVLKSTTNNFEERTHKDESTEMITLAEKHSHDIEHSTNNIGKTRQNHFFEGGYVDYSTMTFTQTEYGITQEETTATKPEKVIAYSITLSGEDNEDQSPPPIEIKDIINPPGYIVAQTEETESPETYPTYTPKYDVGTTTTEDYLPQSREEPHGMSLKPPEDKTTPSIITDVDESMKSISVTNILEHIGNVDQSTTVEEHSRNTESQTEPDFNKESMSSTAELTKDVSSESSIIKTEEIFGKTDSPGLIIGEGWVERKNEDEDLSHNTLTETTASTLTAYTEYPKLVTHEEELFTETVPYFLATEVSKEFVTEITESLDSELARVTAVTNNQSSSQEINSSKENNEEDSSAEPLNEKEFLNTYQSGVLKFTTEIETTTDGVPSTEVIQESTNTELISELNDSVNRKVRSAKHPKVEVKSYPTTECALCFLGLPHGHRMKRSVNTSDTIIVDNKKSNEAGIMQSEKSNCSFSTNHNLEDPENSSFYASTILELLPVIREGYKNNAFNEEDKKVIRSLFGDMKVLMDEDTFEKITESTDGLLMDDGESRIEEIIEGVDYDSSEDGISEREIRLKRSKKNLQMMNDLLKKVPNNLKSHFKVPPDSANSRVIRSTHVSQAEASAILALLSDKDEAVQLDIPDDEDDDEYEYYEEEVDEYEDDDSYIDSYEDDYDKPSFGELIKLARRHRERKARAGQS